MVIPSNRNKAEYYEVLWSWKGLQVRHRWRWTRARDSIASADQTVELVPRSRNRLTIVIRSNLESLYCQRFNHLLNLWKVVYGSRVPSIDSTGDENIQCCLSTPIVVIDGYTE